MSKIHCYICYSTRVEADWICDRCEEIYCEECSYIFSLHYQHQGNRCHQCAGQYRNNHISKAEIRDNKLKLILDS